MSEDFKDILELITLLRIDIKTIYKDVDSFREQDKDTIRKLEILRERVSKLESNSYNQFKDLERHIEKKVNAIEAKITGLHESLEPVTENSILQFTTNMDMKKWAALLSIIISVLASAGILDNVVSSNVAQDSNAELTNRLEELLELSE